MKTETLGTVVAGALRLDQQLDLPDQSRVRVAVEPLEGWQPRLREGLEVVESVLRRAPRPRRRTTILAGRTA